MIIGVGTGVCFPSPPLAVAVAEAGPGGHRYWAINAQSGTNSSGYLSIREVEMRATAGGADETGSGTASADSERSGFEASKAFDDDPGGETAWSPDRYTVLPTRLIYDFGSGNAPTIVEVTMRSRNSIPNQTVRDFDLQYSDNGTDWTTAESITGVGTWSSFETKTHTMSYA